MRSVGLATVVAFSALIPSTAFASLSITNYQFVSEQRVTLTKSNVTYRADLVNTDGALASVTATLTSLNPSSFTVVTGQGTLNFAPVPANSQSTSSNTFTILVNRTVTFNPTFSDLQWAFQVTQIAPVANAGPPQMAIVGRMVTLDGSGSTNPSGIGTLTYSWVFTSRPAGSTATLTNPTSVMPTFVPDVAGNYVITLTVSNGVASSAPSSVTVSTTQPPPPVANAGRDQTVNVGDTVHLNGSASTSGSGNPLTYAWTLTSKPAGSAATLTGANTVSPTFVADKAGNYTAQLTVNDGVASSAPSTVTISTMCVKPVANAGLAQMVNVNSVVQLTGAGSTDACGLPLTFQWSLITRPAGSTAALSNPNIVNPTFTADQPGTYVAQLIVNNGTLSSDAATVTITTNAVPVPTANAGMNQTVNVGSTVLLSGSGTDPQNLPLTFHWSFNSKPAGSTATLSSATISNPTFVADLLGTYVLQLIVNNGFRDSAPATVMITTTCSQPTANPGSNQTVTVGATVTLNGSASGDACHDPLTYAWSFTTRPAGSTATLTGANTVSPTFVADVVGMYVVQLIVNNGVTPSNPATVTITAGSLPTITLTPNPLAVNTNATGTLTVTLSSAAGPGGQVVNLASSNTSIATVPATVTVAQNATTATATVTGVAAGSATITGSAANFTSGMATVNVVSPVISVPANTTIGLGLSAAFAVTLSQAAPTGGVTVTLASSDTSKVTVPASVFIAGGATTPATQPQVTGAGIGSATITASATGYTSGSGMVTVTPPTMSFAGPLTINVGTTGNLTLNLSGGQAPAGGLTVTLSSSDTSKATVPATVSFAAGATSVNVPVTGVAMTSTPVTITASATGITSATAMVTVSPLPTINVPATATVGLGLSATFAVSLSQPALAGGVTVNLSSSDTSKVTVPASVFIAAGATTPATQPQVTGAGIGSATITASATGYTSGTGTVTVTPPTMSFSPTTLTITVGSTGTLTLNLASGQAPAGGLTVNLTSSDTNTATVPATVSFAAGATSATVTVTGVALGGPVTITASAAGITSATATVTIVPPPSIGVPANISVGLGLSATFAVTLSQPAPAGGVTVNLASSDTTKVTVPGSVTIAAGATTPATQPQVTAVGIGSATITATATGYTSGSGTVTVTPPMLSFMPTNLSINAGSTGNLTLNMTNGQAPVGGLTVNLSSSNTSVATVPVSVTFAAGATSATVTVTGVAGGTATISTSAPGILSATAMVNVTSITINVPANTIVNLGQSATFAVSLSQPAPAGGVTVTLTSSDTSKVTVPASVFIAAGATMPATQPQVTGAGIGSATVTASAPSFQSGSGMVIVNPPAMSFSPTTMSVNVGATGNLTLNLTNGQAPAGGLTVNLSSSDTSKATVPATVTFAAGATSVAVPVTGVAMTTTPVTITASATGINSATAMVTVTSPGAIIVPATSTVLLGQTITFMVSLSQPAPAGGLIVTLASTDSSKVRISPVTVSIAAGATAPAMQPQVSGAGIGSATITASAANFTSGTGMVTVPAPTLSFSENPLSINAGTQGTLTLNLTNGQAPAGGLLINLISSNNGVATVPGTVTFLAGMATAIVTPVSGISQGTAMITASAPGITPATTTVNVGMVVSALIQPIVVPSVSVGQNLQTSITIQLLTETSCSGPPTTPTCRPVGPNGVFVVTDATTGQPVLSPVPAPAGGLLVSVTSSDPTKLLIASNAVCPGIPLVCGAQQVKFAIPANLNTASGIYLQGFASSGTVTITASALGFPSGQATITLTPSGFLLSGPGGASSFTTNAGATNTPLTVSSARLDSSLNFAEFQQVRAGYNNPLGGPFDDAAGTISGFPFANLSGLFTASVAVTSSNPAVGTVPAPAVFNGGDGTATAQFRPDTTNTGTTTLTAVAPAGFSTPAAGNSVMATVAAAGISCGAVTVGQHLETIASCIFQGGSPSDGLPVTLTSSDPAKFLLSAIPSGSTTCTAPGSASITVNTKAVSFGGVTSFVIPNFCVYGLATSGTVNYTVTASGFGTSNGSVTLAPSGFVIAGPGGIGAPSFVVQSSTTTITVSSALLDASLNFVSVQALAIGQSANVTVSSSNTAVGTVSPTTLPFTGGSSSNTTTFTLGSQGGNTTLTVNTPAGFSTPATIPGSAPAPTGVIASVTPPGFSLSCRNVTIGKDLEATCTVAMAQPAGAGGQPVTLTSNNPSLLLLSGTASGAGSSPISVTIPAGSTSVTYFAQALASSGTVTHSASATGFTTTTATTPLAPSGVVIAGPFGLGSTFFNTSLSAGPVPVTVFMAVLSTSAASCPPPPGGPPCDSRVTQALRGGLPSVSVSLTSSDPSVGTIGSPVTIVAGSDNGVAQFTPLKAGSTTLSLGLPVTGFTTSTNDTTVMAQVTTP